jgi:monoterpene epsilon-lactone hydrolase
MLIRMIIGNLVNVTLRRTIRRLWHGHPTVENMRRTYANAFRFAGRKRVTVEVGVDGGVGVEWIGLRETAHESVILHLHAGGFVMRGMLSDCRGRPRSRGNGAGVEGDQDER